MTGSALAESARIRQDLLSIPGARLCGIAGCQVITQGGALGANQHRQVCHVADQWVRAD